jgi:predicted nucleic acid-binding protein
MMRKVLLDTDMLISAFDRNEAQDADSMVDVNDARSVDSRRRKRVEKLASNPEVRLWITPLIYYEVMRGIRHKLPAEMEADLKDFQRLEIREVHAHRAAELFRFSRAKGEWLDKRRFDLFHCVCAELDGLEFVSDNDEDISKIQQLINDHPRQP